MKTTLHNKEQLHDLTVPAFGYELIREIIIEDLLKEDSSNIMYWAGKRLARKFPQSSVNDIITFFYDAGWGHLNIKKETRSKIEFELTSELIKKRVNSNKDCHFQLEAGFLAEQIESQKQLLTETFQHPNKRGGIVRFTVKWDNNDPV